MSELVKRQHFVPRTYLKHFAEKKGDEYIINVLPSKGKTTDEIFESNIKNVALKRHLYTLPGQTVDEKMALEKFYSSELEKHYDRIYDILIDPDQIVISDEDRELIISTVVTMFYRTTWWISVHNDSMMRVFERMYELCEQTGKDYFLFEDQKLSIAGKTLEEFTKEYNNENQPRMVLLQLDVAMKLIKARVATDGIMVSKLVEDGAEFITSDNPVSVSNPFSDSLAPFDANNILRLPLDSKHMLLLMPNGKSDGPNRIVRRNMVNPHCGIEKLTSNFQQMESAEKFLFGGISSLESYLKTKEASEAPLEDTDSKLGADELIQKAKDLGLF